MVSVVFEVINKFFVKDIGIFIAHLILCFIYITKLFFDIDYGSGNIDVKHCL